MVVMAIGVVTDPKNRHPVDNDSALPNQACGREW